MAFVKFLFVIALAIPVGVFMIYILNNLMSDFKSVREKSPSQRTQARRAQEHRSQGYQAQNRFSQERYSSRGPAGMRDNTKTGMWTSSKTGARDGIKKKDSGKYGEKIGSKRKRRKERKLKKREQEHEK